MESILFTLTVLIVSIIIHEVAHGYAAYALGDPTAKLAGRLTLNPVPHIDLVGSILIPGLLVLSQSTLLFGWAKPVPYNPYNLKNARWGEAIVGFAGVGTNLLLAVIFALVARFTFGTGLEAFTAPAATIAFVNLFLGMFNLIPLPPLDGYTVLRGLLPTRFSLMFRDFEEKIMRGGIFSLILILFIFSMFLAKPFSLLVQSVFRLLVG
ncbi:site-2 protease family protein [Patescibacteria group bacterium]|nr:site-2 protease family protein [Patescibacteria group bacterium]MBU1755310.1 site-2 protease family protein [Patescibacteria group bacterium]